MLNLFSGQPWRNVLGGRNPLKNSSPANVRKYFSVFVAFAHEKKKHMPVNLCYTHMHAHTTYIGTVSNPISSASSDGLCAFTAFLVSEFSEENIAFYFACEDYRNTKSHAKLPAKAQKIYDEFIGSAAPREVRTCYMMRKNICIQIVLNKSPL